MGKTGSELQTMKHELKLNVKAMLLASKDGMTERELMREYSDEFATILPYAELGYNTLYDLMNDWRGEVYTRRRFDGTTVFYGVADKSTSGLVRLVDGQLDQKKAVRERQRIYDGRANSRISSYGDCTRTTSFGTGFRSQTSANAYSSLSKTTTDFNNGFPFGKF
jgi:hypothetical protein